jgi:hypothetical protein
MTSARSKPEAVTTGFSPLMLEIAGQEAPTPLLIPVLIRNLSLRRVTLAVMTPWVIADWDRYRGRDCVLRLDAPGSQEPFTIKAQIAWSKLDGDSQSPLSLELHLAKPPAEAFKRLNEHLIHTSPDIKGLWERYDQVQKVSEYSHLVHGFYLAGLVLLAGGVVLQFASSPAYKLLGWLLWLIGSLGIAGKVMRSFRQKQASQ